MKDILKWYIKICLFLLPVVFIPWTIDAFGFGKNWMIVASAILGMILWSVDMIIQKKSVVKVSTLLLILALLTAWSITSWIMEPLGIKLRALGSPIGITTITAMLAWVFLWTQVADKQESKKQFMFLTAAGILTAIGSLVVFLLPSSKMPIFLPKNNSLLTITSSWSLTGSLLGETIFIVFLAIEWFKKLLTKLKASPAEGEKSPLIPYLTEAIMLIVFGLVACLDGYRMIKAGWLFLDFTSAWVIAVETLKRNPIFGMGISNFIEGFNLYRPISFNSTVAWTTTFSGSSLGILHFWTELGVVGLALMVWLAASVASKIKSKNFVTAILLVAAFLFLPVNPVGLLLMFWFLSTSLFVTKDIKLSIKVGEKQQNILPVIVSVLVTMLVSVGAFFWTKILLADVTFRDSLVAASKNDGSTTYNKQIKAIALSKNDAEYRRIYSQTNMSLAKTILVNKERSKEDEEKAVTLIQQAVREAKVAISLDQKNPAYWINLGVIYKDMIGLVDGAADWSFQALNQASSLDPVNSNIKLDIGGMLYAAEQYDQADRVFQQAVQNKQDYPNAWYNWAYSAKKMNNIGDAIARLTNAVKLVSADSGDYEKATKELETWKKEYDELVKKQQELLKQQQAALQSQQPKQPETLKAPEVTKPESQKDAAAKKVVVPTGADMAPPKE